MADLAELPTTSNLVEQPETLWARTTTEIYAMDVAEIRAFQLDAFRRRFETLLPRIPMVTKLAAELGLSRIDAIEDAAPLLLKHSVYKSYPISFIEKNQFDRLTRWLNNLTAHDLSGVEAGGAETIDDWIDLLDTNTPIRVRHSSGTSGKLSFLPTSTAEDERAADTWRSFFEGFGDEPDAELSGLEEAPIIFPSYRYGAMAQHRRLNALQRHLFGGNGDMIITLNKGRLSADALSLGGRLQAAAAKGELGEISLSAKLRERREEFLRSQAQAGNDVRDFFAALPEKLGGRRIQILGAIGQFYDMAAAGLAKGMERVFASNSLVMMGGGMKGRELPADYMETICRFLGTNQIRDGYGMTELTMATRSCPHGHYHLPPVYIPFILDPKTGEQQPRTGFQKGRLGVYDLSRTDIWGGFLTGDAVEIHWGDTSPCACGRKGAYLTKNIRRYSQEEGGDDKITCAGAPEAHDNALEFINRID